MYNETYLEIAKINTKFKETQKMLSVVLAKSNVIQYDGFASPSVRNVSTPGNSVTTLAKSVTA